MATPFTHAFVALTAGKTFFTRPMPTRLWVLGMICSALPDADVIGFSFGVRYGDLLGHRGFFHSLPFAMILSLLVVFLAFRNVGIFSRRWWGLWVFFFLVSASHGVLDAMTDGGLGIALFSPFVETRYFLPWRPLVVPPIGIVAFLSAWGARVVASEVLWVWVPATLACMLVKGVRFLIARKAKPDRSGPAGATGR